VVELLIQPGEVEVLIRPEKVADRPAVQALIAAAFAPADHADGAVVEAVLTDELRRDPGWIPALTLVADRDGVVVGQVTCSYGAVRASDRTIPDRRVVGVGPVAVLPDYQGAGIGSEMMRALIDTADSAGEPALVLLGSPVFYGRFGFVASSKVGIASPDPSWGEHFQVRTLTSYDPGLVGRYSYAAPFANL
jgi:putative acetyltransferase